MKKIAVFASGAGTNAARIIDHFNTKKNTVASVSLIVCNKPGAGVISVGASKAIPSMLIEKERFSEGDAYVKELTEKEIDLVVLAGFLWKIPTALIKAFPDRIINIHPALLPKYGGKGMYGQRVHQAVIDHQEKETGITIHLVDEVYDHGRILFQAHCPVLQNDSAASLAVRVARLEHEHYPLVIEKLLK